MVVIILKGETPYKVNWSHNFFLGLLFHFVKGISLKYNNWQQGLGPKVPLSERNVSADCFLSVSLTETEFADRFLPVLPENQTNSDRMSGGEKGQSSVTGWYSVQAGFRSPSNVQVWIPAKTNLSPSLWPRFLPLLTHMFMAHLSSVIRNLRILLISISGGPSGPPQVHLKEHITCSASMLTLNLPHRGLLIQCDAEDVCLSRWKSPLPQPCWWTAACKPPVVLSLWQ